MVPACRSRTELMAKKLVLLLVCIVLWVVPGLTADIPKADQPEFVFARLVYSGDSGRGGSWATDVPEAKYKFVYGIRRLSGIRLLEEQNPVRIMDPRFSTYPYIYPMTH